MTAKTCSGQFTKSFFGARPYRQACKARTPVAKCRHEVAARSTRGGALGGWFEVSTQIAEQVSSDPPRKQ